MRRLPRTLSAALVPLTMAGAVLAPARPAHAIGGANAPLSKIPAAQQRAGAGSGGDHATGLVPPQRLRNVRPLAVPMCRAMGAAELALPDSVDLSPYAPPVGNQGQVNSCGSWAIGYYLRGWYARRDNYYPAGGVGGTGGFAPMYLYSQIVRGSNTGTSFDDNMNILQGQGIDPRAGYTQGDYNYTSQPTADETRGATPYKIASWRYLFGPGYGTARQQIETSMAGGNPVVLAIPVYGNFDGASASNAFVDVPAANAPSRGYHALFAAKYDSRGVWIENSWGTIWGQNGWAELSWAFVNTYAYGVSMTPLAPPPTPATATPSSTATTVPATATPRATATTVPVTATPRPTITSQPTATTPRPTATSTPRPTLTATATARPTMTPTQKPTTTSTPRPTATSAPRPSATATARPASTNTPYPTATATKTVVPTTTSTSTPRPAATAISTARPTSTALSTTIPTATATNASRPTATGTARSGKP